MSLTSKIGTALLSSALILSLAACEDAEQKAQRKYENAEALIEAGDLQRAEVELRGIFDLMPEHLEARMAYADLRREMGDIQEAYGQYLLAAQQHPKVFEARIKAAEMSALLGDFDRLDSNLDPAATLEPENPRVNALLLVRDLRDARRDNDTSTIEGIRDRAKALLETDGSLVNARNTLIDASLALNDPYGALEQLDAAIALYPKEMRYYTFKLQLLGQLNDSEGIGAVLKQGSEMFPDDKTFKLGLVRWYLGNDDKASADAFMKADVERKGDDIVPRIEYVQYLLQVEGTEAALAQIDAYVAEGLDDMMFRTLRASTMFDNGRRDEAIEEMRSLLATADTENADDETRSSQIALARMLQATGKSDEAAEIVTAVLEADPRQVEALKLQAERLIDQDRVGDAILSLRTAMDQAPRDAALNTLMARAHEREGNRDLMRENLQIAVEKSGYASSESRRFAQLLISEEKFQTARDVLTNAVRRAPADLGLLQMLAQVYMGMADWSRAEQIIKSLGASDDPQAQALSNQMEAQLLSRMQRTDESMELLRGMMENDSTALMAQAAIIRAHLSKGDVAAARSFMDEVLSKTPDSPGLRFLNAALLGVEGNFGEAAAVYRGLIDENPRQELVWRAYVSTLANSGDAAAAEAALDEGMAALPDSMNLMWQKAGFEEKSGNVEGAIDIYQKLYDRNSNSTIVANNLASLITSYRDSQEDLSRAYVIARRLKGTQVPAFQDTYGWIAFRMGNVEEALPYLQNAAATLSGDPMVQQHYARVLAAAGRPGDAVAVFDRALQLAGDAKVEPDVVAEIQAARDEAAAKAAETPN
ncbi:tetratricopeptide repeat protein [Mangrovicoccus sp. HB161399]|uniref:tetratricopeptide repeat protein n=1 Tax=Mangrovicoccus sp. HB161399 TaxID=2720392 RepID=UPI001554CEF3|nr:tetratricopeptide repeat protein [Mangrovicoccus sp. HB161399]